MNRVVILYRIINYLYNYDPAVLFLHLCHVLFFLGVRPKLCENYENVTVEVVDCPDLTKEPFNLAAKGINGNVSILDVGDITYIRPTIQRDRAYDLRGIPKMVGDKESFIIGAGAGLWWYYGTACELMINAVVTEDNVKVPLSRTARIVKGKEKPVIDTVPDTEPGFSFMAQIHSSRGESGKVIKIHCQKRTGEKNFPVAVQDALKRSFPNSALGLGGVMMILKGRIRQHVQPEFSRSPLNTDEDEKNWLKFFEMSSPLTAIGTILTKDPGLDVRLLHFHSFSENEGGHYHNDVTPEDVEYLAYFSLAKNLYRVDRKLDKKEGLMNAWCNL
ncbi:ester hydrolase C11orf54 homolog [Planococcus citri]|uniref:ester hydrolase C11orf54 homolog n=1 Tax=Planococcus citri TaxID=170843 RepID=UPI0031FA1741